MDPLSVVGVVESSLSLALQLATVAKSLSDVVDKYKNAKLTVKALIQNLDILQLTWTQIGQWFEAYAESECPCDDDLIRRVRDFLDTGTLVMEALGQDLLAYDIEKLSFTQRSKLIWNESILERHLSRIRDQTLSMNLYLQSVKLPTPKARAESLQKSDEQFRKSNESAYSVIPSQSSSFSEDRNGSEISSHRSLEYQPLGFEHVLFTSKVYTRNTKNMMIEKIRKFRDRSTGKCRVDPVPTLEATQNEHNAESLLLLSEDVPTEDEEIGYLLQPDRSPTPFFEQLLLAIANYINRHIAPHNIQVLTPVKLAAFYRLLGGDFDLLFLETSRAFLSFIYQTLGCFHTLEQEEDLFTRPCLPVLTCKGFVRWYTIQLLLEPAEHGPFLQMAVERFDLTNPITGTAFPSTIPQESLPCQPDAELVEWHENIAEKLMLEANASNRLEPTLRFGQPIREYIRHRHLS